MNRYLMISRLRWPALLLLTGVIALLVNFDKLEWSQAWPLYLILLGVLALAERASLASQPPPADPYSGYQSGYPAGYPAGYEAGYQGYPTGGYPPQTAPYAGAPVQPTAPSTSIVPVEDSLEHNLDRPRSKPFTGSEEEGR
jgi:hypothetical protein